VHQEKAWEELGMELGGTHGGVEAQLVGGTPTSATAGRGEARKSFATARRCSCAQKEGERCSGEGLPAQSQAPTRKSLLRRGITGRRRLTMTNRLEHRLRKVEAMLLARWRWLRRTGAVGTANSGDGMRRRRVLRLLLALAEARERSGGVRRSAARSGR